jgi:poly-beta-1,6-N-acetyl-D-glucosamine N-deacetylase
MTASFLSQTGVVRRQLKHVTSNNLITSVLFHNPPAALFEGCVRWLVKNEYHFISADDLYDILTKASEPPKRAVCLSVDDGWRGCLSNIVPVIDCFRVPVCFFISTEPVENGVFWWTYADGKVEPAIGGAVSGNQLKTVPNAQRQKEIDRLKACVPLPREAMTKEEVGALAANPFVTVGSHTVNHACLNRCTPEEQLYEIRESKRVLSEWTNKEVLYFSYPNGDTARVDDAVLRENGYRMAFTTKARFLSTTEHGLFHLPRFAVNDDGPLNENICKMTGTWQNIFAPKWEGE